MYQFNLSRPWALGPLDAMVAYASTWHPAHGPKPLWLQTYRIKVARRRFSKRAEPNGSHGDKIQFDKPCIKNITARPRWSLRRNKCKAVCVLLVLNRKGWGSAWLGRGANNSEFYSISFVWTCPTQFRVRCSNAELRARCPVFILVHNRGHTCSLRFNGETGISGRVFSCFVPAECFRRRTTRICPVMYDASFEAEQNVHGRRHLPACRSAGGVYFVPPNSSGAKPV